MTYDPVTYWSKRANPNKYDHIRGWEREILGGLVDKVQTIFEYGPGNGRLFPLYDGKDVTAYDILDKYKAELEGKNVEMASYRFVDTLLNEQFDLGVLSKVVLHEPEPQEMIDYMVNHCNIVYISTGINLDADHCFNHDYSKLLDGFVRTQIDNDLIFVG